MRRLAFLFLSYAVWCSCTTLSSEDRGRLASYQRNAALYYEGNRLPQALGQIDQGLELEPDDYKLNTLLGAVLLRQSGQSFGTDHQKLDRATEVLAKVYDGRAPSRHEPILLLNYGLCLQKQGRRHLGEAIRLEGQASRTPEGEARAGILAEAATERAEAQRLMTSADEQLAQLVERGELLRVAHNHRLQIARELGDDAGFLREAEAFFGQSQKAIEVTKKRIDETATAAYEAEQQRVLRDLRDEELAVRALCADFHWDKQQYEPALRHLDRVIESDPRRFSDYYNRGRVLLELGRADDAKADFRRFLADPSLASTSERATFALQALER
jgi:tetratricopeptide (TPR) repeat protein